MQVLIPALARHAFAVPGTLTGHLHFRALPFLCFHAGLRLCVRLCVSYAHSHLARPCCAVCAKIVPVIIFVIT